MITVVAAPPYLTVQDLGRVGHRAAGVAPSGAMDPHACRMVNAMVGNAPDAAVLEWALAGGVLRFDRTARVALGGASVVVTINGETCDTRESVVVPSDGELRIERFVLGRFVYVAVAGGIDVPIVLGSRSTNLAAKFGGVHGRTLRRGDVLPIGAHVSSETCAWPQASFRRISHIALPNHGPRPIRVVRGPQAALFDETAWATFLETTYTISRASDRMGYRLDGASLQHRGAATFPSEPTCVGAIQIPHGGTPIVLMNDGPTVGGYPKIAVVVEEDRGALAQCIPGEAIRFVLHV